MNGTRPVRCCATENRCRRGSLNSGQKAQVFAHIVVREGLWRRSQGVANLLGGAILGEEVDRLRPGQPRNLAWKAPAHAWVGPGEAGIAEVVGGCLGDERICVRGPAAFEEDADIGGAGVAGS